MTLQQALARLDLLIQMATIVHGTPRFCYDGGVKGRSDRGSYERFNAAWIIDGANHGIGIDYYRDNLFHIHAWGHSGQAFIVELWAAQLRFPMLVDAAYHVGLLTERE